MIVLAGDVGGTNARLALVELNGRSARITAARAGIRAATIPGSRRSWTASARTRRASRPRLLRDSLPRGGRRLHRAQSSLDHQRSELAAEIGIPRTTIINDFVAVGYGIELLGPPDLATLQEGTPTARGTIALIGAGTGLGQGFLFWEGDHYQVLPSEGGHVDFAPRGKLQTGLLQFLRQQFDRVSWERLLSGPGIVNIYRYLLASEVAPEQDVGAVRDARTEDPAAVITRHGLARTDCLSDRAVDLFCEILGAQAGNLALTVVATGGVYLAGGIAPRMVERLESGGRFSRPSGTRAGCPSCCPRIPVHVIMNPSGLLGAAAVAGSGLGAQRAVAAGRPTGSDARLAPPG